MVLLAAAVCTRSGKTLVSRQFVEMSRARIEGMLSAFPKLITGGKQHTFIETESVRYVYQSLEKLFVVLITTKASNILEDLETLRLFAKVIPEYSNALDETGIVDSAFQLIFAFDEIVALGYRENVNLHQIRTLIEMDSVDERVYNAVRQNQEREAKLEMKRRAKELNQSKREMEKSGGRLGGYGNSSKMYSVPIEPTPDLPERNEYTLSTAPKPASNKAMKLKSKGKEVDSFLNQLKSEGQEILSSSAKSHSESVPSVDIHTEKVHISLEEKLNLTCDRHGGLDNIDVQGILMIKVADEEHSKVSVEIDIDNSQNLQIQTHPNIDKNLFHKSSIIGLKDPNKAFLVNKGVAVVMWHIKAGNEAMIPLSINCWPTDTGKHCEVNIEYELNSSDMTLRDVDIIIPIPAHAGAPVISEIDGTHHYESRRNQITWKLDLIDSSNPTGTLVFTTSSTSTEGFFPINVNFQSTSLFCGISIKNVFNSSRDTIKYSCEPSLAVDKYQIV